METSVKVDFEDDFGLPQGTSKTKIVSWRICIELRLVFGFNARTPPEKMSLSENVVFRGLRLSLCHFGQQVPEGPVSQLQNGASTSSLPPFIVDWSTFKVYQRSISFFQCKLRVLNGQFHDQSTMGRNSSVLNGQNDVGLTQGRPGKRKDTWERTWKPILL